MTAGESPLVTAGGAAFALVASVGTLLCPLSFGHTSRTYIITRGANTAMAAIADLPAIARRALDGTGPVAFARGVSPSGRRVVSGGVAS
jgi:hypothetical protein